LACADQRWTYEEMDECADRLAAGLAELGVAAGERIAFVAPNRPEMLEMLFGCARAGAIQVPLNAFLRGEFLRYQLGDSRASTIAVDGPGLEAVANLIDDLPDVKRIIVFDDAPADVAGVEVVPYSRIRSSEGPVPAVELDPSDLISIVYTSGTTGLPKGCMLSHGYYLTAGTAMQEVLGLEDGDVFFTPLPLFHGAARMLVTTAALVHGLTAVIEPEFHLGTILQRLAETQATFFFGVGAMGMAMLAIPESDADRAHNLRGGCFIPMSEEVQARFADRFGVEVNAEAFGQTECVPVCYSPWEGPRSRATAGRPSRYLDVRLVDDEDNDVPVGEVGEILIRPKRPYSMYSGYWNKSDETVKAWRNLWHHTGDFGRADTDGFISFVDRKKDALRRRGENISSMELEMAIAAHPKIAEAAVHAVPSPLTEDDVKACIVVAPDESVTPEELFDFFKTNLPYFAVPRYVEIVPELPKNAVMRVMKHKLREKGVTETTWDLEALGLTVSREERR
jgi:crotonobetaine/carnitine-CoA ligase